MIVAIGKNNEIGKKNELLWNLLAIWNIFEKQQRIARLSWTKNIWILGERWKRQTNRQITPNRRNIIITQDASFKKEGAEVVYSVDELMNLLEKTSTQKRKIS